MKKPLAIIGFLIFFHFLFFDRWFIIPGSLGLAVFITGCQLFILAVFWRKDFCERREGLVFTILALSFAWLGVIRGSRVAGSFLWLGAFGFTGLSLYTYAAVVPQIRSVFELCLSPFVGFVGFIKSFFTRSYTTDKNEIKMMNFVNWKLATPVVRGLIVALPVLGLLVLILSSADPIFAKIIKDLFRFSDNYPILIGRLLVTLIWLGVLIPITRLKLDNTSLLAPKWTKQANSLIEAMVVVGLTAVLVGWFLVIQWRYLFANVVETKLYQYGIKTYSEYVSRGFNELIIASFVMYFIIGVSLIIYRSSGKKLASGLGWLNMLLVAETGLLLISVLRRLVLYQQFHGLTVARVYGLLFIFWLVSLLVILVARHLWEKRWVIFEIGTVAALLMVIGLTNVEGIVADKYPPTVNGEVDETYLAALSSDGYVGWKKAYQWAQGVNNFLATKQTIDAEDGRRLQYAQSIVASLFGKYGDMTDFSEYGWTVTNFRQQQIYGLMVRDIPEDKLSELQASLGKIRDRVDEKTKAGIQIDRAPGRFLVR